MCFYGWHLCGCSKGGIDEFARVTKGVRSKWEEGNNDGKEDSVEFGSLECEDVQILGYWVGDKVDYMGVAGGYGLG